MFRINKFTYIVSAIIILLSLYIALPNLLSNTSSLNQFTMDKRIKLGLDLKGGSQLLLELEIDNYLQEKIQDLKGEVRYQLRSHLIGYINLIVSEKGIEFDLLDISNPQVDEKLQTIINGLTTNFDVIRKGKKVTIHMNNRYMNDVVNKVLAQSIEIIRRRIDELGTNEPIIQKQGRDRILLQVPGISNPEQLKDLLGKTAKLSFHIVNEDFAISNDPKVRVPNNMMLLPLFREDINQKEGEQEYNASNRFYVLHKKAILNGENLVDATAGYDEYGSSNVNFKFDSIGSKKLGDVTSKNVGKMMAIVLDGQVISAPVIRDAILSGSGVINGDFSFVEANNLALLLRAGALPVPLNILEERTVGPSLGVDSIRQGQTSMLVGLLFVVVFMIIFYKISGICAVLALLINLLMLVALITLLGITITLPGMAGIVLTFGMAVDANVLIFERIKEEMKHKKSIYASIDGGFTAAFKTIFDSNVTTLLVSIILFSFGVGLIKGFALTLSLGIICSMYSSIFIMRIFLLSWVKITKKKVLSI